MNKNAHDFVFHKIQSQFVVLNYFTLTFARIMSYHFIAVASKVSLTTSHILLANLESSPLNYMQLSYFLW